MDTLYPKPDLATTHTSAGRSPRLSVADNGGEALAEQISCSQEGQEDSNEDSESEGGVLLT
jgi:hypothetical protein